MQAPRNLAESSNGPTSRTMALSEHPEFMFFQALNAPFLPSVAIRCDPLPQLPVPSAEPPHTYDTPLFKASGS
ncbi:hypothetical protein CVT25_012356 [Psilocybe cyanescens]|uniref:Uncharacterized protein n=1 Tax=Psilocybe cyanescens TaxID=93625 RepID=A0A409XFU3_PSICY|nr:hypothetical protein CVT25_012356 [Psilocybe cyanescens]